MKKLATFQRLQNARVVAVMRRMKPDTVTDIVSALKRAGVTAVEITVEHPDGFSCIERLKTEFEDDLVVGAGTILDAETAKRAIDARTDFLVTPVMKKEVITIANRYGLLVASGAMTPTEILTAYESGADIVKVFPAEPLGTNYLKHLKGPLGHIPLMPTGGINLENLESYLQSGVVCVGIGSALYNYHSPEEIEHAASRFMKVSRKISHEEPEK